MSSCDIYVGVIPQDSKEALSDQERGLIEKEYEQAKLDGLERLIFIVAPNNQTTLEQAEEEETDQKTKWGSVWEEIVASGSVVLLQNAAALLSEIVTAIDTRARTRLNAQLAKLRTEVDRNDRRRRTAREGQRVVNLRPLEVTYTFRNRLRELQLIQEFLADHSVRLISVVGRSGMGKTALVSRVLSELEKGALPSPFLSAEVAIQGILYLSARSTGLGLERIYADVGRMLGEPIASDLASRWAARDIRLEAKVEYLLEKLQGGMYIILLDNLEDYLTEDGVFTQEGLGLFVEGCLTQPSGACLLVTSRIEVHIPDAALHGVRKVPLRGGLAEEDAVALLRDLDPQGVLNLRDAPDRDLRRVASLTRGIPRALETLAGILEWDSTVDLAQLLSESNVVGEQVAEKLVAEGFNRLGHDERRVMQALAVLDRPVGVTSIAYVLHPWFPGVDVRACLRHLARGYFVNVSRGTGEHSLHPLDRDYAYSKISAETDESYTRRNLELRAADFFHMTRKSKEGWRAIEDLVPQLEEFEHRFRARDFEGACTILAEIDFHYLLQWGQYSLVIEMRERLAAQVMAAKFTADNLGGLARAYYTIGEIDRALDLYERALTITRQIEDREETGLWLDNIGVAHYTLGRPERAIGCYDEALEIARETRDRMREVAVLSHLALARRFLGHVELAERLYGQALNIARELGDRRYEGIDLGSLGTVYLDLGKVEEARRLYEEALEIAREIGDRRREDVWLGHLGMLKTKVGQYGRAIEYYEQAIAVTYEIGDLRHRVNWLSGLGDVYAIQGQIDQSVELYEGALRIADEIGYRPGEAVQLLALGRMSLMRGQLDKAAQYCDKAIERGATRIQYKTALVLGVVRVRQKDARAKDMFAEGAAQCRKALANSPAVYEPRYKLAGCLLGLAICHPSWADPSERLNLTAPAVEEYLRALEICSVKGVVEEAVWDFEMIRAGSSNGLELVGSLLKNE